MQGSVRKKGATWSFVLNWVWQPENAIKLSAANSKQKVKLLKQ